MFDIGWTELLLIACVAIIVVGPKDLPRMLRTLGQQMGKMRRLSREFQSTFNDALREAEKQADIADMKEQVESVANFDPLKDLKKSIEDDKFAPKGSGSKGKADASPSPSSAGDETEPKAEPVSGGANAATGAEPVAPADTTPATPESQAAKQPVAEETKA